MISVHYNSTTRFQHAPLNPEVKHKLHPQRGRQGYPESSGAFSKHTFSLSLRAALHPRSERAHGADQQHDPRALLRKKTKNHSPTAAAGASASRPGCRGPATGALPPPRPALGGRPGGSVVGADASPRLGAG